MTEDEADAIVLAVANRTPVREIAATIAEINELPAKRGGGKPPAENPSE